MTALELSLPNNEGLTPEAILEQSLLTANEKKRKILKSCSKYYEQQSNGKQFIIKNYSIYYTISFF